MNIDLTKIPFSRFGSYLAFSILPAGEGCMPGLYLRSVRGPATGGRPMQEVLHMELMRGGKTLVSQTSASFTCLSMTAGESHLELCLPAAETARIRLQGADLHLQMPSGTYDNIIPGRENTWLLTANSVVECKLTFSALKGHIQVDAPWQAEHSEYISITLCAGEDGIGEFAIDEGIINWRRPDHQATFDESLHLAATELTAYTDQLPAVPSIYAETRLLAGYVLWSCTVKADGHLKRPAIFASKNGMIGVWSWDHAFHSLALAEGLPQLAWDQMMVLFDLQDESGALPDLANDRLLSWSFCKPPVHGWILSRLWRDSDLMTAERLDEIYAPLCRWTDWWLRERDENGDGFPQCNHGNDGGWDNSTVFSVRPPVETPDICAYLVLQMDFLAQVARRLGKEQDAGQWTARADDLNKRLLAKFWRGDHFTAVQAIEQNDIASESLLLYIPLLLGKRLPTEVRESMIKRLKTPGEFLSPYGLATESLKSPFYRPKGYWRGPVWPAPVLILIDALERCAESEFAQELRLRFCELVREQGMAENFDALTGQGYHDFHFSWTAAIFLVLAHELGTGDEKNG